MNKDQLRANFLESEIEEIVFTYDKTKDIMYFSDYSVSMLGISKCIEHPFSSKEILKRISIEDIQTIISEMNLKSVNKEEMVIQFMNKPFLLKYQIYHENNQLQSIVCLMKEKMEY